MSQPNALPAADSLAALHPGFKSSALVWLGVMVALWGFSWPVMKICVGLAPPLWLAAIRFTSSGLCLFAFLACRGELRLPPRADWPIVASVGGLQMMAFTGLGLVAMQYTDAGRAALLAYTTPLWAVVTAWIAFGQRPTAAQGVALCVGLSGVAVICSPADMDWGDSQVLLGNALLLLSAMCWSFVILHVRRHRFTARPIDLAPWQMLLAALPLIVIAASVDGSPLTIAWTPELIGFLIYFGPIATSACFVISSEYGRRVSAFAMSNITLGVPVIGMVSSILLLGERVTVPLIIGLALIVSGVALAALAVNRKAAAGRADTALRSQAGKANWPTA
ncbi:EamA family transporter [Rhodospirillum rubrum]|uniref:DMT family transporter n=1 Tax=Rhodospirillum rubrum TaxID=1085 RepID=UPI0019073DE0|nr:DMT family transporter [Rhodospirillum rubrum]MBK1665843.1 EamA family transporter [Rhodospirillum rubrum]MBK1677897.1 EamA family transporter [Rhodospirillum rubrum]